MPRARQIDYIMDTLDDFLLAGDFSSANDFIQNFLDQTLPIEIEYGLSQYLSVVCISHIWRKSLNGSRDIVLERAKEMYRAKYGDDQYIINLS